MSLPEQIGVTVDYVNNEGQAATMVVEFLGYGPENLRTYQTDSEQMEVRKYTSQAVGVTVRNICLVANRESRADEIVWAAQRLALAIAQFDVQRFFNPQNQRGAAWPITVEMLEGQRDGSIPPRGRARCIRYVDYSRWSTVDIGLPRMFAPNGEES